MSDRQEPARDTVCGICGEPIERREQALFTSASVLHVTCVERSAAAA